MPGLLVDSGAFASTTIVTEGDVTRSGAPSQIADAISTRPGVSASTFAPGSSRPLIRGLENYRVRLQENGVASHDVSDLSEDHGVPMDPNAADRIEIVRGPAALRYGSQAIGGVVSVENNRIPQFAPRNGFSGVVRGSFDSVSSGSMGSASLDAGSRAGAVHADVFYREAGDYATPRGRQANSSFVQNGGSIGASVLGPDGYIGASITHFASRYHVPGEEAAAKNLSIDLEQTKLNTKGEIRFRDSSLEALRFWAGFTDYRHDEIATEAGVTEIGSTFRKRAGEARVELQHRPVATALGELRGAFGTEINARKLSAAGEGGELLAPNRTTSIAAYLFEELRLTRNLRLQGAARIEGTRVEGTAGLFPATYDPADGPAGEEERTRRFVTPSVSAGALYDLPLGLTARATAQIVSRAPDAAELFSKGPHEATATFEIGDPNLRRERATAFEIGLARAKGNWRVDMAAFWKKFDGFVFKRFTGLKCDDEFISCAADPTLELDQIVYSQRDATFRGFEFAGELDVGRVWNGVWGISAQFDVVRATFADGTNVPRIAPMRIGGGLFYRDENWRASISLLHAFAQKDTAAFETSTAGYNLLNADVSYTFRLGSGLGLVPSLTVGLAGQNLLDEEIRNHVSYKKDEVLQPGRNVRLYGTLRF
ncbi:MAG TPA: TonB-dependent receptor [Hyphomicrobiaceae bacterium]|nr:TonB-dependent receptor [Hyphomicrobiaceae bacterium]